MTIDKAKELVHLGRWTWIFATVHGETKRIVSFDGTWVCVQSHGGCCSSCLIAELTNIRLA